MYYNEELKETTFYHDLYSDPKFFEEDSWKRMGPDEEDW